MAAKALEAVVGSKAASLKQARGTLIVCPLSVMNSWEVRNAVPARHWWPLACFLVNDIAIVVVLRLLVVVVVLVVMVAGFVVCCRGVVRCHR